MSSLAPNQRIFDVLSAIKQGTYRIPNIQRGYEWDEERVTKLLDSVMSGYPVGAVMVWRPKPEVAKDIPTRQFIQHFEATSDYSSDPSAPTDANAYLVLDGQQRLQSLYISFFGTYNKRAVYLRIDHIPTDQDDDTDYSFEFLTTQEAEGRPEMVPLAEILQQDSETKYDFARELAEQIANKLESDPAAARLVADEKQRAIARNVDRFIERFNIQQALLFQEVDKRHDYDHVLEIFERVNSGGMVLDKSDLLFSTLKLKLQRMEQAFGDTLKFLAHGDRYEFNTDFLIKACLVVFDQKAKYEVTKLKNDKFVEGVDRRYVDLDHCLRHLSMWLDETARIKCSRFLRSRLALVPLVDWMMLAGNHDKPDGENAHAMTEYLYMAMFRRLFRPSDSVLDQLHVLLRDAAQTSRASFPIEKIRAFAVERQRTPWELHPQYFEDDADLVLNIADGGVLQIDPADPKRHPKDLKLEVDHIFPRAPLGTMGLGDIVNHLGNYRLVVMPVNRRKLAKMPDDATAFFGRRVEPVETAYRACVAETRAAGAPLSRAAMLAFRDTRAVMLEKAVSDFLGVPLAGQAAGKA